MFSPGATCGHCHETDFIESHSDHADAGAMGIAWVGDFFRLAVHQDLAGVRLLEYRDHLGVVLQETFLFDGTIAENIAYGRPDASMDEIVAAASAAQAHEFITDFKDGYDTIVGERGVTLSGGQKQRTALARGLIRRTPLLILDDCFSAVDTETEDAILSAIPEMLKGRTSIIVAHRISTLKTADMIVVLDNGRIVADGPKDTVLQSLKSGKIRT